MLEEIDTLIETGRHAEARAAIDRVLPDWSAELARRIVAVGDATATDRPGRARPGYLVLNPIHVPRRAAVVLPDAALDLRPEGPLRVAQFTEEGVWGVVDLPALGFRMGSQGGRAWTVRRPRRADCRPRAASSKTNPSRSRSTRPRGASAAWRPWANRRPGSVSNWS